MSRVNIWTGTRNEIGTASVPTRPELPREAVQEAIVNAICHRDYRNNDSVQVMLFRNRLEIWNPGILPFGLTVKKLYESHKSIPPNPLLAESMYYKGFIEKAGTGTEDIVSKCKAYGLPTPLFQQDEDFKVVIYRPDSELYNQETPLEPSEAPSEAPSQGLSQGLLEEILNLCREPEKLVVICGAIGFTNRTKFRANYIVPLIKKGYLEMTFPDKPQSSNQRYRLTEKGRALLLKYDERVNNK
jgi:predicted HTH transcriptional regulator